MLKMVFNWYDPKSKQEEKPTNMPRSPEPSYLLQFFEYSHLPPSLQRFSAPFYELAHMIAVQFPSGNPEASAGLRKLLEAKDCAVRAALMTQALDQAKKDFMEKAKEDAARMKAAHENKTKG